MTMKASPDRQRFIAEYRRFLRNSLRESGSVLEEVLKDAPIEKRLEVPKK